MNSPGGATADPQDAGELTRTRWLPADKRSNAKLGVEFTNQNGAPVTLDSIKGLPVAVTFLYTRCTNRAKCPLVAKTMVELQQLASRRGLEGKIRLAIITYDPDYDQPQVLRKYGAHHGLRFDDNNMMLRPNPAQKQMLFDHWKVTVNHDNKHQVNLHGIQLLLLDAQGRFVRSYHTLIWDNAMVLDDLHTLSKES